MFMQYPGGRHHNVHLVRGCMAHGDAHVWRRRYRNLLVRPRLVRVFYGVGVPYRDVAAETPRGIRFAKEHPACHMVR